MDISFRPRLPFNNIKDKGAEAADHGGLGE